MIGKLIHNYKIEKKLGEGGMGEVYLGIHIHIDRKVAIKILNPNLSKREIIRKRFKNEAKALDKIQHPNIVKLHDYYESDDLICLIMEYVDGLPLDEYVSRLNGKVPVEDVLFIFNQILDGMNYAHQRNIIHRDIKPSNLMISDTNEVKILDFGIAKILGDSDFSLTTADYKLGTVLYMSPEQILAKDIDHQSDIYSLGVTLFQLLTGKHPYTSIDSEYVISDNIVKEPLPDPRNLNNSIPDYLCDVINHATEKDKNNRIKDIVTFTNIIKDNSVKTIKSDYQTKRLKLQRNTINSFTDPRDNKVYKTVKIGNDIWMAENLAYTDGLGLIEIKDNNTWLKNKKYNGWCYYENNKLNGEKFGVLYQGIAARIACPPGWHLPSDKERKELIRNSEFLKSDKLWKSENYGGSESSRFYSIPGGMRNSNGVFQFIYAGAYYWISKHKDAHTAKYMDLFFASDKMSCDYADFAWGFSVRCVKD